MNDLVLITPPVAEPVTVAEMLVQLGMGPVTDDALSNALTEQLQGFIAAARDMCETYTRSVYMTQTWLMKRDGFPFVPMDYNWDYDRRAIVLTKMPFQSMEFLKYVDTAGVLQALAQDASYGTNPNQTPYGYQLDPGGEIQPARLTPLWASLWPPTRMVPSNVLVQFKCGFGGPVFGAIVANSAVLVGPKFLASDVGQLVTLPGAGAGGADLLTSIASVDDAGQATLADAVTIAVTKTTAIYIGKPVPAGIRQAVKFLAQFFYEQGAAIDMEIPRVVKALLDPYRNLVA